MPTYAGIPLVQPTPEIYAHVAHFIPLSDVCEFEHTHRLTKLNIRMPYGEYPKRPIKLGSLYWPVGASRWAIGHFLASESQLTDIRKTSDVSRRLIMSDGTNTITTTMSMLPPRPLAQNPMDSASFSSWLLPKPDYGTLGEPVYLLTLVDDRYNWWDKVASSALALAVTEGTTTWTQLFQAIATALGLSTITLDDIDAAYLKPPADLSAYQEYLPVLLDVVAFSVGHRVVRSLDGTVSTQNASTAWESMQSQLDDNLTNRVGGGQFAFNQ